VAGHIVATFDLLTSKVVSESHVTTPWLRFALYECSFGRQGYFYTPDTYQFWNYIPTVKGHGRSGVHNSQYSQKQLFICY